MGSAEGASGAEQVATQAAEQAARDAKVDDTPPTAIESVHEKLQPLKDRASQEMGADKFHAGGVLNNGASYIKGEGPARDGSGQFTYWGVWDPKAGARAEYTVKAPRFDAPSARDVMHELADAASPDHPDVHPKLRPLVDRASERMDRQGQTHHAGVLENGKWFVKGEGLSAEGGDRTVSYWGVLDSKTPSRAELTLEAPPGSTPPREPLLRSDTSTQMWTIREEPDRGPAPPIGW